MLCYFYHVKTVSIYLNYSQDVGARIFRPTFEKLHAAFTEDWVLVNVKINSIVSSTAYGEVYINLSKNTVNRSAYNTELLPVTSVLLAVTPIKKTRDERFLAWGVNYGFWSYLNSGRKAKVFSHVVHSSLLCVKKYHPK